MDINLKLIQVAFQKNCELISKEGDKSDGIYTIVSLKTDSEDIGQVLCEYVTQLD